MEMAKRAVGKTKSAGWQVGMRRTLPIAPDDAWRLVTSPEGVRAWLGEGDATPLAPGRAYTLADGSGGEVRVLKPGSHLRITWHPEGWPRPSTIQVRVIPAARGRATLALHQEHMPDAAARERRLAHFAAALDELARLAGTTEADE
jgi:uncharacterized protein YndB with AHSA1/START domain